MGAPSSSYSSFSLEFTNLSINMQIEVLSQRPAFLPMIDLMNKSRMQGFAGCEAGKAQERERMRGMSRALLNSALF